MKEFCINDKPGTVNERHRRKDARHLHLKTLPNARST
jgi:hypothetical protein